MREVSASLSRELLDKAEVLAVAEIEDDMRFQLLAPAQPLQGEMVRADLVKTTALTRTGGVLATFFAPDGRLLLIEAMGSTPKSKLEVLVPEAPLKAEMIAFARRIAGLSILIALIAASVIYVLLHYLVVSPMRRVTESVMRFQSDPGGWSQRIEPTRRRDEIGRAQNALADMEAAVAESFRQKAHLAELGTAVAKISHDLRGSLATAQLVSETLETSDDPRVRRALPRLERALQRALRLAKDTLAYGKTAPDRGRMETVHLRELIESAAEEAQMQGRVIFHNDIAGTDSVKADPDYLHRIAVNLLRNAAEAISAAGKGDVRVLFAEGRLDFADTGPGLPQAARDSLFKPFAGSTRLGGTGLGLAIAAELAGAMSARLELVSSGPQGTLFRLHFPSGA
jgi:hypothetical protein